MITALVFLAGVVVGAVGLCVVSLWAVHDDEPRFIYPGWDDQ